MNQLSHSLPPRVRHKHGAFYYVTRIKKWVRLGKTWEESEPVYQSLITTQYAHGTMGWLITKYMDEVAPAKAPRTYQGNIAESRLLLGVFGHMKPQAVKPMDVAGYLDERGKVAPVRANREKALLSHIFTKAMRWGITDWNPCRGVSRNPETPRDRYITDAEFDAVRGIANEVVQDMMDFALCTGQRGGDLLGIMFSDIDDEGVMIEQNKTRTVVRNSTPVRLKILLSDSMREIVERRRKDGNEYLFSYARRGKEHRYTETGFKSMFKRSVVKALKKGLITVDFTFHDLRAKALTDASRMGMNAQAIAGHKNASMTEMYIKRREHAIVKAVR